MPSLGKSDHLVLVFKILSETMNEGLAQPKLISNYKRADIDREIFHIAWDEMADMDTQTAWNDFENKVLHIKEKHVPKFKKSPEVRNVKVDKEILSAIMDKKRKWKKYYY